MENIKACIRIKPTSHCNPDDIIFGKYDDTSVLNYKTKEMYNFEEVFDANSTTDQIFSQIGEPLINNFFEGVNVCVFAYGQTSSGKTHTMKGSKSSPGFIPKALAQIFQKILESQDRTYEIRCSYIEIYNENVHDLLNPANVNLEIRENLTKGIHIPGLTENVVQTQREALQFFELGESARKVGETQLNEHSSRSHTIFRVSFEAKSKLCTEKIIYSTLNLVDLAGSEGVSKAKTEGLRKKEGANINKSLLALSTVISKLAMKDTSYINYRDSKLTRLLQPCLGGNSRTVVVCTINPLFANYQETINTFKFAISAGAIKNQVQVNEKTLSQRNSLSKDQLREYNELKMAISKSRELFDNMLTVQTNKIDELEKQLIANQEEGDKLRQDLDQQREESLYYIDACNKKEDDMEKLKKENQSLLNLVSDVEFKIRDEFEKKTGEFEKAYTAIDRRLNELHQENEYLRGEKKKIEAAFEQADRVRITLKEEKDKVIKYQQEQIDQFKRKLNIFNGDSQNKASREDGSRDDDSVIIQSEVEIFTPSKIKRIEADFELKMMELENQLKVQIIEKNKMIMELNNKVSETSCEMRRKDEKIVELQSQVYSRKAQSSSKDRNTGKENNGGEENLEEFQKRRKIDFNLFAKQSLKRFNENDELHKEMQSIHRINSSSEQKSLKKKQREEERNKKLHDITNITLQFENQLAQNLSLYDRNF